MKFVVKVLLLWLDPHSRSDSSSSFLGNNFPRGAMFWFGFLFGS